jgi:NADH-quinone oxidoreductase subunit L
LLETLALDHGSLGFWTVLYLVALATAFLTAFYAGRQLLLVLAGDPRSDGARHATESSRTMTVPLVGLALLTVVGGLLGLSIGGDAPLVSALAPVVGEHEADAAIGKLTMAIVATAVSLGGLFLAWLTYGPRRMLDAARVTRAVPWAYRLAWNAFYVDEVYAVLFVRPFRWAASFLWVVVDDGLIDGAVNVVGRATMGLGQASRRLQTGYVRTYVLAMLMGAVVLAAYALLWLR